MYTDILDDESNNDAITIVHKAICDLVEMGNYFWEYLEDAETAMAYYDVAVRLFVAGNTFADSPALLWLPLNYIEVIEEQCPEFANHQIHGVHDLGLVTPSPDTYTEIDGFLFPTA